MKIIDVNASFGFWPIQNFPVRTLSALDKVFEQIEVSTALISAIESILFPEPDTHDWTLFEEIRGFSRFHPVKTVNPVLANWKQTSTAAISQHPIAAIKLFPNYHNYSLRSEIVDEVCRFAIQQHLPVLIQMRVNDERNQPSFLQVPGVSAADIAGLSHRFPQNQFIALCAYNCELPILGKGSSRLLVDTAFLDGSIPLGTLDESIGEDRLVFGSHAPFLYPHSAALKLKSETSSPNSRNKMAADNFLSSAAPPLLNGAPSKPSNTIL